MAEEVEADGDGDHGGGEPHPEVDGGAVLAAPGGDGSSAVAQPQAVRGGQQEGQAGAHQDGGVAEGAAEHLGPVGAEPGVVAGAGDDPEQEALGFGEDDGDQRYRQGEPEADLGERGGPADAAAAAVLEEHPQHGEQDGAAGLLGERAERDRDAGGQPAPALRVAEGGDHGGQHEDFEGGGLGVLGREPDGDQQVEDAGAAPGLVAPAPAGERGEQDRGGEVGADREGAQRPERGGAEEREAGLVEPGQQRGFAVDDGVVEDAAVGEHPGLGGEVALVGAPHGAQEGRQVGQRGHDREQRDQSGPVPGAEALWEALGEGTRAAREGEGHG